MVGVGSDQKLTIIEHLDELRQRLIVCVIAVAVTTLFSFFFAQQIIEILKRPAPEKLDLVYTEMMGGFTTQLQVGLMAGIALALPVIAYQIIRFVSPALTKEEKRFSIILLPGVLLAFATGVAFGYFLVLPFTTTFLLTAFSGFATPLITVGNYISFVATMLFWIGLSFESPIIIFFLAKLRIVTTKKLAAYRKYAVVAIFVAAAIITPTPDPITQSLVAVPLLALYEIGILLSRFA